MRTFKRILSQIPLCLAWIIISTVFWGWIFTLATDTVPAKKVTVFIDAYKVEDTYLSARLEEDMPSGLKMIKVHPFSYTVFDSHTINNADIFIVRAGDIETYITEFIPISADGEHEYYYHDGSPYGIKVYDAKTGEGIASEYITYYTSQTEEYDCYLFFCKNSPHIGKENGAADGFAFDIADILINLKH